MRARQAREGHREYPTPQRPRRRRPPSPSPRPHGPKGECARPGRGAARGRGEGESCGRCAGNPPLRARSRRSRRRSPPAALTGNRVATKGLEGRTTKRTRRSSSAAAKWMAWTGGSSAKPRGSSSFTAASVGPGAWLRTATRTSRVRGRSSGSIRTSGWTSSVTGRYDVEGRYRGLGGHRGSCAAPGEGGKERWRAPGQPFVREWRLPFPSLSSSPGGRRERRLTPDIHCVGLGQGLSGRQAPGSSGSGTPNASNRLERQG